MSNKAKMPDDSAPMIEWALYYAGRGCAVFPLRPGTKTGYYEYPEYASSSSSYSWKNQATTDPKIVRRFWTDHPDANIGCRTGEKSGYTYVLDLDVEHTSESGELVFDGRERLREWERDTGKSINMETWMVKTGRGGSQIFYKADPSKMSVNGRADIFGESTGNDTRGDGNYVVLPPSIHPNGNRYQWEQSPEEYEIRTADDDFYAYWNAGATKKSESGSKEVVSLETLKDVGKGGRHEALKHYIGNVIRVTQGRLSERDYEVLLWNANESLAEPIGKADGDNENEYEQSVLPMVKWFLGQEMIDWAKAIRLWEENQGVPFPSEDERKKMGLEKEKELWRQASEYYHKEYPDYSLEQSIKDYYEWKAQQEQEGDQVEDPFPQIEYLSSYQDNLPPLAEPLIDNVLRCGHKLMFAGGSKVGKSFLMIELAIAIAEGQKWLKFWCKKGKVLYINLEIDPSSCINRFDKIYKAKGMETYSPNIAILNLRGKAKPLNELAPIIIDMVKDQGFIAIILDPIYKVITGDENNASEMGAFCNQFDTICSATGCSMIYSHHHSKGGQGQKRSIDRASGSGVFGRDPDAILDILELEMTAEMKYKYKDTNTRPFRLECTLREFPTPAPVDMWYQHPLHVLDLDGKLGNLRPENAGRSQAEIKQDKRREEKERLDEAFSALDTEEKNAVSAKDLAQVIGVDRKTIGNWIDRMDGMYAIEKGMVFRCGKWIEGDPNEVEDQE